MNSNRYCVIMAGGIGTRFWPMSRQSCPKQFLDILGTGKSFIRHTYERFNNIIPKENFIVVTNSRYKELVLEHIPELKEHQILCEPIGRNTAPCIAYAAYTLRKINPDAEMIVTPADHLILNENEFLSIVGKALDFITDKSALMTIGITPTRPETGYGYIQRTNDNNIIIRMIATQNSITTQSRNQSTWRSPNKERATLRRRGTDSVSFFEMIIKSVESSQSLLQIDKSRNNIDTTS